MHHAMSKAIHHTLYSATAFCTWSKIAKEPGPVDGQCNGAEVESKVGLGCLSDQFFFKGAKGVTVFYKRTGFG